MAFCFLHITSPASVSSLFCQSSPPFFLTRNSTISYPQASMYRNSVVTRMISSPLNVLVTADGHVSNRSASCLRSMPSTAINLRIHAIHRSCGLISHRQSKKQGVSQTSEIIATICAPPGAAQPMIPLSRSATQPVPSCPVTKGKHRRSEIESDTTGILDLDAKGV
jgi:hypothetical protein